MDGVNVENEIAWQTVSPKHFTKRARQLDQASREMSAQAACYCCMFSFALCHAFLHFSRLF